MEGEIVESFMSACDALKQSAAKIVKAAQAFKDIPIRISHYKLKQLYEGLKEFEEWIDNVVQAEDVKAVDNAPDVHEVVDIAVIHDEIVALTVVHEVVDGVVVVNNDDVSWPYDGDDDIDYSHYSIGVDDHDNPIRRPVYQVFENTLQFNSNGSLDLSVPVNRDIVNNITTLQCNDDDVNLEFRYDHLELRDVVQVFYINDHNEVVTRRFATDEDCCRYFNIDEWRDVWVDLYHAHDYDHYEDA